MRTLLPSKSIYFSALLFLFTLFGAHTANSQSVEKLISDGNSYMSAQKFGKALACFHDALILDADNQTAKAKIIAAEGKTADRTVKMSLFEENITAGSAFMDEANYKDALLAFKAASYLRPESSYPKNKIREIVEKYPDPVVEKGYNDAISKGDNAFQSGNYAAARKAYQHALEIKPAEAYPTAQLTKAEQQMSQSQELRIEYEEIIARADALKTQGKDKEALVAYQQASEIMPSESYPKQQSAALAKKIEAATSLDDKYQEIVTAADNLYMAQKYEEAQNKYREALKIKQGESYPQSMITRIEEALMKKQSQWQQYNTLVKQGDVEAASGNRDAAISKYKQALAVFPNETYPADKIKAIEDQIANEAETKKAFNDALANADREYAAEKYENALAFYTTALALNPENKYAKDKIAEVNGIIAERQAKEKAYNELLADADNLFNTEQYAEALGKYRTANQLRPEDPAPAKRITEIEGLQEKMQENQKEYDKHITKADKLFRTGELAQALVSYEEAAKILPEEQYPKTQINNINNKIKDAEELKEAKFQELVTGAEKDAENENFADAIDKYSQAAGLKPENKQITARIDELKDAMEKAGQRDNAFDKIVARADTHMQREEYEEALAAYTEALGIKPDAQYAISQKERINSLLQQKEAEKQAQYDGLIKQGDIGFENEDLAKALHSYSAAAELYPDQAYPKDKITEINGLINEADAAEAEYLKAISKADKLFKDGKYNEAQQEYQNAGDVKPDESYPKLQIIEINKILAAQQKIEKDYQKLISEADQYYAALDFDQATLKYREALKVKPQEEYPSNQIREIEALKKDIAQKASAYDDKIDAADRYYTQNLLEKAKKAYEEAKGIRPNETYPDEQLALINSALADQEAQNKAFADAMKTADDLFDAENFNEALAAYQQALEIKPGDEMAKTKISATEKKLNSLASKREGYENLIRQGDASFDKKEYYKAKEKYSDALALFPDEEYPKTRLTETNDQIALVEQQRRIEYEKVIETADGFFGMGQYKAALENYRKAKSLLSTETYPTEKIAETEAILREQQTALLAEYQKLVGQADTDFNQKRYANALVNYEKASKLGTGESYPFQMISKIKGLIAQQVAVDIPIATPVIQEKGEAKLIFTPLHYSQKKNNYIILTARNNGEGTPKVFLSFGSGNQKNGGVVITDIVSPEPQEYIIPMGGNQQWYRENNNWIKLFMSSGSIEVISVRISNIVE